MITVCKPGPMMALGLVAFSTLLAAAAEPQQPTKPQESDPMIVEKIRGDYALKVGSVNGVALTADRVTNVTAKITDQTITTYDGQREQRFGARYRIVNDHSPWHIDLKSVKKIVSSDKGASSEKVEQAEGIIDVSEDGQRLRIAYATEGARPKDFKPAKHHNIFEFERLKTK